MSFEEGKARAFEEKRKRSKRVSEKWWNSNEARVFEKVNVNEGAQAAISPGR